MTGYSVSPTPIDRFRARLSAEVRRVVRASMISFVVTAGVLLTGSVAVTYYLTGAIPSGGTWMLIVGGVVIGATLTYHGVGALMLVLLRARLLSMLLELRPSREELLRLLPGAAAGDVPPAISLLIPLMVVALMLLLLSYTRRKDSPPQWF